MSNYGDENGFGSFTSLIPVRDLSDNSIKNVSLDQFNEINKSPIAQRFEPLQLISFTPKNGFPVREYVPMSGPARDEIFNKYKDAKYEPVLIKQAKGIYDDDINAEGDGDIVKMPIMFSGTEKELKDILLEGTKQQGWLTVGQAKSRGLLSEKEMESQQSHNIAINNLYDYALRQKGKIGTFENEDKRKLFGVTRKEHDEQAGYNPLKRVANFINGGFNFVSQYIDDKGENLVDKYGVEGGKEKLYKDGGLSGLQKFELGALFGGGKEIFGDGKNLREDVEKQYNLLHSRKLEKDKWNYEVAKRDTTGWADIIDGTKNMARYGGELATVGVLTGGIGAATGIGAIGGVAGAMAKGAVGTGLYVGAKLKTTADANMNDKTVFDPVKGASEVYKKGMDSGEAYAKAAAINAAEYITELYAVPIASKVGGFIAKKFLPRAVLSAWAGMAAKVAGSKVYRAIDKFASNPTIKGMKSLSKKTGIELGTPKAFFDEIVVEEGMNSLVVSGFNLDGNGTDGFTGRISDMFGAIVDLTKSAPTFAGSMILMGAAQGAAIKGSRGFYNLAVSKKDMKEALKGMGHTDEELSKMSKVEMNDKLDEEMSKAGQKVFRKEIVDNYSEAGLNKYLHEKSGLNKEQLSDMTLDEKREATFQILKARGFNVITDRAVEAFNRFIYSKYSDVMGIDNGIKKYFDYYKENEAKNGVSLSEEELEDVTNYVATSCFKNSANIRNTIVGSVVGLYNKEKYKRFNEKQREWINDFESKFERDKRQQYSKFPTKEEYMDGSANLSSTSTFTNPDGESFVNKGNSAQYVDDKTGIRITIKGGKDNKVKYVVDTDGIGSKNESQEVKNLIIDGMNPEVKVPLDVNNEADSFEDAISLAHRFSAWQNSVRKNLHEKAEAVKQIYQSVKNDENAEDVVVVETSNDLPQEVAGEAISYLSSLGLDESSVENEFNHMYGLTSGYDGKAYIILDNNESLYDIVGTVKHEALHQGVARSGLSKKERKSYFDTLMKNNPPKFFKELVEKNGGDVEEAIALVAESTSITPTLLSQTFNYIGRTLAKIRGTTPPAKSISDFITSCWENKKLVKSNGKNGPIFRSVYGDYISNIKKRQEEAKSNEPVKNSNVEKETVTNDEAPVTDEATQESAQANDNVVQEPEVNEASVEENEPTANAPVEDSAPVSNEPIEEDNAEAEAVVESPTEDNSQEEANNELATVETEDGGTVSLESADYDGGEEFVVVERPKKIAQEEGEKDESVTNEKPADSAQETPQSKEPEPVKTEAAPTESAPSAEATTSDKNPTSPVVNDNVPSVTPAKMSNNEKQSEVSRTPKQQEKRDTINSANHVVPEKQKEEGVKDEQSNANVDRVGNAKVLPESGKRTEEAPQEKQGGDDVRPARIGDGRGTGSVRKIPVDRGDANRLLPSGRTSEKDADRAERAGDRAGGGTDKRPDANATALPKVLDDGRPTVGVEKQGKPVTSNDEHLLGGDRNAKADDKGRPSDNGQGVPGSVLRNTVDVKPETGVVEPVVEKKDDTNAKVEKSLSNFEIKDEYGIGETAGKVAKFNSNIEAIKTLKKIEAENRFATEDEKKVLSKYNGWGGIQEAFYPKDSTHKDAKIWSARDEELRNLLTDEEFSSAENSVENAHYTPVQVVRGVYDAIEKLGVSGSDISFVEFGCGIGNFMGCVPASIGSRASYDAVEIDGISYRIAKLLYPKFNVKRADVTKLKPMSKKFDVAIGNPPFSRRTFNSKEIEDGKSGSYNLHTLFIGKQLNALRPNGIGAFVVSSFFLDASANVRARGQIAKKSEFIGAVRLPNSTFKKSADASVLADIVFFRKRPQELSAGEFSDKDKSFINTSNIKIDGEGPFYINKWIDENKEYSILGDIVKSTNIRSNPIEVKGSTENIREKILGAVDKIVGNQSFYQPKTINNSGIVSDEQQQQVVKNNIEEHADLTETEVAASESYHNEELQHVGQENVGQEIVSESASDVKPEVVDGTVIEPSKTKKNAGKNSSKKQSADVDEDKIPAEQLAEMKRLYLEAETPNGVGNKFLRVGSFLNGKDKKMYIVKENDYGERYGAVVPLYNKEKSIAERFIPLIDKTIDDLQQDIRAIQLEIGSKKSLEKKVPKKLYEALDSSEKALRRYKASHDYKQNPGKIKWKSLRDPLVDGFNQREINILSGMVSVRDLRNEVVALEHSPEASDEVVESKRHELAKTYDAFVKNYKNILTNSNKSLLSFDATGDLISSVEYIDNGEIHVSDIISKRVFYPVPPATLHPNDAKSALNESIKNLGFVDVGYIAKNASMTEAAVEKALSGEIFFDPRENSWEPKNVYLSGDVKTKLSVLNSNEYANDSKYDSNRKWLEKALPKDLHYNEITVPLGTNYIGNEVYSMFLAKVIGCGATDVEVVKMSAEGVDSTFSVNFNKGDVDFSNFNAKYPSFTLGADEVNTDVPDPAMLIRNALNNDVPVVRTVSASGQTEINTVKTREYSKSINALREDWVKYIQSGESIIASNAVEKAFNERINRFAETTYDGDILLNEHGKFNGSDIKPYKHQSDAVSRIISTHDCYLNHVVGAGKTNTAVMAVMECIKNGSAKKPVIVVQKSLLDQWHNDIIKAYPGARVYTIYESGLNEANRKRTLALMQTANFDIILLSKEQFRKIPLSEDAIASYLEYEKALVNSAASRDGRTVKSAIRSANSVEATVKANEETAHHDDSINFDDLGIDMVVVDEAHYYKSVPFKTKLGGRSTGTIVGLGAPKGSAIANDMQMKLSWMRMNSPKSRRVRMSGTPITNSLTELYGLMRLICPQDLAKIGILKFDDFANEHLEISSDYDVDATGGSYKLTAGIRHVTGVGQLMTIIRQYMDVVTREDLEESMRKVGITPKVPKVIERSVISRPSEAYTDLVGHIDESTGKYEDYKTAGRVTIGWSVQNPGIDPKTGRRDNRFTVLKAYTNAKKLSLDPRCLDPDVELSEEDLKNSKIYKCAESIYKYYKKYNSVKGTQLVFCDLSVPKKVAQKIVSKNAKDALEAYEYEEGDTDEEKREKDEARMEFEAATTSTRFSAYDELRRILVEDFKIPNEEIEFIHDHEKNKTKLFSDVNKGVVRVLMGSTAKMGTGMNVQKKIVALHHLDVPVNPAAFAQRKGREERQGNELFDPENPDKFHPMGIHHITKGTYDAKSNGDMARKAEGMEGIWTAKMGVDKVGDISETTEQFKEFVGDAAGEEVMRRFTTIKNDIENAKHKINSINNARENAIQNISRLEVENANLERQIGIKQEALKSIEPRVKRIVKSRDGTTHEEDVPAGGLKLILEGGQLKDFNPKKESLGLIAELALHNKIGDNTLLLDDVENSLVLKDEGGKSNYIDLCNYRGMVFGIRVAGSVESGGQTYYKLNVYMRDKNAKLYKRGNTTTMTAISIGSKINTRNKIVFNSEGLPEQDPKAENKIKKDLYNDMNSIAENLDKSIAQSQGTLTSNLIRINDYNEIKNRNSSSKDAEEELKKLEKEAAAVDLISKSENHRPLDRKVEILNNAGLYDNSVMSYSWMVDDNIEQRKDETVFEEDDVDEGDPGESVHLKRQEKTGVSRDDMEKAQAIIASVRNRRMREESVLKGKDLASDVPNEAVKHEASFFGNVVKSLSNAYDFATTTFVDAMYPAKKLQKISSKNAYLHDTENIGQTSDLNSGFIEAGAIKIETNFVTPIIDSLARAGIEREVFDEYLVCMYAPERNTMIKLRDPNNEMGSGISDVQSYVRIDEIKKAIGDHAFGVLKDAADTLYTLNRNVRHAMAESGIISKAQLEAWDTLSPHYVPLRDADDVGMSGVVGTLARDAIKSAVGRYTEQNDSVFTFSIMQAIQSLMLIAQNRLNKTVYNFCNNYPSEEYRVVKTPYITKKMVNRSGKNRSAKPLIMAFRGEEAFEPGYYPLSYYREKGFTIVHPVGDPTVSTIDVNEFGSSISVRTGVTSHGKENIVVCMIDGDRHFIEFNSEPSSLGFKAAQAINRRNLFVPDKNTPFGRVFNALQMVTRLKAEFCTTLSPSFAVRNAIADVMQTVSILLAEGDYKSIGDVIKFYAKSLYTVSSWIKNGKKIVRNDEFSTYLKDAIDGGFLTGGTASQKYADTLVNTVINPFKVAQLKYSRIGDKAKKPIDTLKYIAGTAENTLESISAVPEIGLRFAVFVTMRKKGMSIAKAANYARNITVDFNKKGTITPITNMLYMFSNAAVQALVREGKAIRKGGIAGFARLATLMALKGFLLNLIMDNLSGGGDDDRRKKNNKKAHSLSDVVPDYVRKVNDVIPIGGGWYATLPTRGLSSCFAYLGSSIYDWLKNKKSLSDVLSDNVMNFAENNFELTGKSGSIAQMLAPTIFDPFVQMYENRNYNGFYNHRPEKPDDHSPKYTRAWNNTNEIYKGVSRWLNEMSGGNAVQPGKIDVYPENIRTVSEFVSGTLGKDIARFTSLLYGAATLDKESFAIRNTPIIGSLLYNKDGDNTTKYYSLYNDFNTSLKISKDYKSAIKKKFGSEMLSLQADYNDYLNDHPALIEPSDVISLNNIAKDVFKKAKLYEEKSKNGEDVKALGEELNDRRWDFIDKYMELCLPSRDGEKKDSK